MTNTNFQFHNMFSVRKIVLAVYIAYGVVFIVPSITGWVWANKWRVIGEETVRLFQRPYKIIISNHTVETFSSKCRANASFADTGIFSLYVEFLNNLRQPFVHTELYFKSDNGNYDMELVNRTIDMCKFFRNKRYEPIVQVVFKLFEGYLTHWFSSCPTKKVNVFCSRPEV